MEDEDPDYMEDEDSDSGRIPDESYDWDSCPLHWDWIVAY